MAHKYLILAALLATVALVAAAAAADDDYKQKEVKLMLPLFDRKAKELKPSEVLDMLHKLEELYVSREANGDEAEKNRREVVFTLAARAELKDSNCQDRDYFVEFKQLIKTVNIPNIKLYLEHYMREQVKACRSRNPDFEA